MVGLTTIQLFTLMFLLLITEVFVGTEAFYFAVVAAGVAVTAIVTFVANTHFDYQLTHTMQLCLVSLMSLSIFALRLDKKLKKVEQDINAISSEEERSFDGVHDGIIKDKMVYCCGTFWNHNSVDLFNNNDKVKVFISENKIIKIEKDEK